MGRLAKVDNQQQEAVHANMCQQPGLGPLSQRTRQHPARRDKVAQLCVRGRPVTRIQQLVQAACRGTAGGGGCSTQALWEEGCLITAAAGADRQKGVAELQTFGQLPTAYLHRRHSSVHAAPGLPPARPPAVSQARGSLGAGEWRCSGGHFSYAAGQIPHADMKPGI